MVLTAEEARKKGFRVNRRRKPNGLGAPNRPKCIWKVNRKNEKQKVKDKLAAKHGISKKEELVAFEDDEFELEDDDDESDALDEEDDHPNPFIL